MRKTSPSFQTHVYDPDCTKLKQIINEIKPETVRYSATITLKPRMYQYKAEQQYDMTYPELIKHLSCNNYSNATIISELTKNYNVHYHITITFQNPYTKDFKINFQKQFVDSFRKSQVFGFVNIKQIDSELGWIEYISKDLKTFIDSTGRRPIIKDDFNYFTEKDYAKYGTEW